MTLALMNCNPHRGFEHHPYVGLRFRPLDSYRDLRVYKDVWFSHFSFQAFVIHNARFLSALPLPRRIIHLQTEYLFETLTILKPSVENGWLSAEHAQICKLPNPVPPGEWDYKSMASDRPAWQSWGVGTIGSRIYGMALRVTYRLSY